jgi:hypothetical protein
MRFHLAQLAVFCCLTVSGLGANVSVLEIKEDFESYSSPGSEGVDLAGKGYWRDSAFGQGRDPVVVSDGAAGKVLKAPVGGDHHILFIPPKATFQQLLSAPAWCLEFDYELNAKITIGRVSKWSQPGLMVSGSRSLSLLSPDKTTHTGLVRPGSGWHRLRLLAENDFASKTCRFSLYHKELRDPQSVYKTEDMLTDIVIPFATLSCAKWTGLSVRLDSRAALDNLRLYALNHASDLKEQAILQESTPPFKADLSGILPPRQAHDLSGLWEYYPSKSPTDMPAENASWRAVLVPDQHSELFREARKGRVWFRTTFNVPKTSANKRLALNFESVTGDCDIYVNNTHVEHRKNRWVPFETEITEACRPGQQNQLLIAVKSAHDSAPPTDQPMGWSWYGGHYNGIAFPVFLEVRDPVFIADVFPQPKLTASPSLNTDVTLANTTDKSVTLTLSATVGKAFTHSAKTITLKPRSSQTLTLSDPWASPQLWWPHDPHLYDLRVSITQDGRLLDAKNTRFGFRDVRVEGPHILVNNRKLLHRRASPIVYYPHLQKSELTAWFERYKHQGYNGLRLHGGAPGRILNAADEAGMLICYESKLNEPRGHQVSDAFWPRASQYLTDMVRAYRHHPSVIYWAVSNEFGSYYMKGTPEKKAWVDNWLHQTGQRMMRLDPTRTVTYCGDCELGGKGKHGPAPNLNFHYAWQQTKPHAKLPASIYWLEEGGVPWQQIVWDRTKPILLNEDIYPAYCWNPPWGMTQWSGDSVFEEKGYYQSWFDAIRMLAEGYYHAGVACWNPWATNAGRKEAPLYELGKPMPDFLLATREWNRAFQSSQQVGRHLFVYNKTLKDVDCRLVSQLNDGSTDTPAFSANFALKGGETKEFEVSLPIPTAKHPLPVSWSLKLTNGAHVLSNRTFRYTVFPEVASTSLPPETVVVANSAQAEKLFFNTTSRCNKLEQALIRQPKRLILVKPNLSPLELERLDQAVQAGLNVLFLEAQPSCHFPTPLKVAEKQSGSHAFIRSPHDPLTANLKDEDLKWWAPDTLVFSCPILKPSRGNFDILIDAGSADGLNASPLLRLRRGKGAYTICQLSVVDKVSQDPACAHALKTIVSAFANWRPPQQEALTLLASQHSATRSRLAELQIPFSEAESLVPGRGVLLIDASEQLTPERTRRLRQHLDNDGTVILQRLSQENSATLSTLLSRRLTLAKADVTNLVRKPGNPLLDGISNDDLCWQNCGKKVWAASGKKAAKNAPSQVSSLLVDHPSIVPLTTPAGIARIETDQGRLFVCQLNWDTLANVAPARSARFALTFLKNLGADIGNLDLNQRTYAAIELPRLMNRGFETQGQSTGWFGEDDDMRFFPVNRTGIDPFLKVPKPVESFPEKPVTMGGVPFKITDPDQNNGTSCIVLEPSANKTVLIPIGRKVHSVWLLGALSQMLSKRQNVASLTWQYAQGPEQTVPIESTVHLNGYQWTKEVTKGKIGWTGPSKKQHEAVVWAWDHRNPVPDQTVTAIRIDLTGSDKLAIIAATSETIATSSRK